MIHRTNQKSHIHDKYIPDIEKYKSAYIKERANHSLFGVNMLKTGIS